MIVVVLAVLMTGQARGSPDSRLYVFDCGTLTPNREGVERYHVTMAEVGEIRMPVPCFLIAHPRGTLMWDVGVIPDAHRRGAGGRREGERQSDRRRGRDAHAEEPTRAGRLHA